MDEITKIQESIIDNFENQNKTVFAIDLCRYVGKHVYVCGIVVNKTILKKHDCVIIYLKDITGSIRLRLNMTCFNENREAFHKSKRICCCGEVTIEKDKSDNDAYTIINVKEIDVILSFEDSMDNIVSEKESALLMSRIISLCSTYLNIKDFKQIETKLISTYSMDEGLSSLKVVYPGFGEPVYLSTSPSPQLLEFLLTAYLERVFTVSVSFSPTYRSPGMGTEERVIAAKATNLGKTTIQELLISMTKYILDEFNDETSGIVKINNLKWGEVWRQDQINNNEISCLTYNVKIPVKQSSLHTTIREIYHIVDNKGFLLMEGAKEVLIGNEEANIYTIIVYPNQFLSAIHKKSIRTIRNLWRVGNESKRR